MPYKMVIIEGAGDLGCSWRAPRVGCKQQEGRFNGVRVFREKQPIARHDKRYLWAVSVPSVSVAAAMVEAEGDAVDIVETVEATKKRGTLPDLSNVRSSWGGIAGAHAPDRLEGPRGDQNRSIVALEKIAGKVEKKNRADRKLPEIVDEIAEVNR